MSEPRANETLPLACAAYHNAVDQELAVDPFHIAKAFTPVVVAQSHTWKLRSVFTKGVSIQPK